MTALSSPVTSAGTFLDTGLPELWGRVLATEEFGKIDRLSDHGYGQLQGDLDGGLR